jgi:hypothetical protein
MLINNFMKFCKDFKINEYMEMEKLAEIYKKNAKYQKYLNYE